MGKARFKGKAPEILRTILGVSKEEFYAVGFDVALAEGFNADRAENIPNALEREIGLSPVVVNVNGDIQAYNKDSFVLTRFRGKPDGSCKALYHPGDCEAITGSKAGNWTQWTSRLLGYGRGDHPFAPKVRVPDEVAKDLRARGLMGRKGVTRLLTTEMVVFYMMVQTKTWANVAKMNLMTSHITRYWGIATLENERDPDEYADDANAVDCFTDDPQEDNVDASSTPVQTNLPKAAAGLVGYIPKSTMNRVPGDNGTGDVEADVVAAVDDFVDSELQNILKKIEELQEQAERLLDKKYEAKFLAEAKKGFVVGGEVWARRGEWRVLVMQFPETGREVRYLHPDAVAVPVDDVVADLQD